MTTALRCARCGTAAEQNARFCGNCGAALSASAEVVEDQLLTRLRAATEGEYDVLRELGRGGMAAVYLAWDRDLARHVAVKVLLPELAHHPGMSPRFLQEARTAANLDDHPSVVRVYRAKESDGLRYFVMKYVDGCSLDQLLRATGPLPPELATHVIDQVALALQYAHEHGVIHRDVKPGNILLDRTGGVVVTDFGIAKVAEAESLTRTGLAIGTPHYMSPEQWRVEPLSAASDQYALGVVAHHAVVGGVPFDGTQYEIQEGHLRTEPTALSELRPGVPGALEAVVGIMLAKRPDERFPDLYSVSRALAAVPREPVPVLRAQLAARIAAAAPDAPVHTPIGVTPARGAPPVRATPAPVTPTSAPPAPAAATTGGETAAAAAATSLPPMTPAPAAPTPPTAAPAIPTPALSATAVMASVSTRVTASPVTPPPVTPPSVTPPPVTPASVTPAPVSGGGDDALPPADEAEEMTEAGIDAPARPAGAPAVDLPTVVTSDDVPLPSPRPRSRAPLIAVGALVAVAAGVFATRRGVNSTSGTVATADTAQAVTPPITPPPALPANAAVPPVDSAAQADSARLAAAQLDSARADSARRDSVAQADSVRLDSARANSAGPRVPTAIVIVDAPAGGRATLPVGDSLPLHARVNDARGFRMTTAAVRWGTTDPGRVAFRRNWAVALAPGGPVEVVATSGTLRRGVLVQVTPRPQQAPPPPPPTIATAAPSGAEVQQAVQGFVNALRGRDMDALGRRLAPRAADNSESREFVDWVRGAKKFGVGDVAVGDLETGRGAPRVSVRVPIRYGRGGLIGGTNQRYATFYLTLSRDGATWHAGQAVLASRFRP